ncbi:transposase domain-containing protein [Nonomuraea sp. NPDC050786]|uniref:transposase domain-containing protein n=1 Tax=Nonomuraea sp. NPDC050786 TaxID=3154840 RepID=UPI0033EE3904
MTSPADWGITVFSTWSLAELRDHLLDRGTVAAVSREMLHRILRDTGIFWQTDQNHCSAGAPLDVQSVMRRDVVVAAGAFAPGHLGELTRLIPFEMVDEALAGIGRTQVRHLPLRVVVYLLPAGCFFPELGWRQVWQRPTARLAGLKLAVPTAAALVQARRRAGVEPVRWLWELLRGPAAAIATTGVWWRGLRICAIDGTTMAAPDTAADLSRFTKHRCNNGGSGYCEITPVFVERLSVAIAAGPRLTSWDPWFFRD